MIYSDLSNTPRIILGPLRPIVLLGMLGCIGDLKRGIVSAPRELVKPARRFVVVGFFAAEQLQHGPEAGRDVEVREEALGRAGGDFQLAPGECLVD